PANTNSLWSGWVALGATDPLAQFIVNRLINRPSIEFYDIQADPYELNNLADDPRYKSLITRYTVEIRKWMLQQGDTGAAVDKVYSNVSLGPDR
ncbi:MAG TPA: hypothetical protein VGM41_01270, partial [Chitinophagaceae bacterium]